MTKVTVIIGANYGDEGKGLTTDFIAHNEIEQGRQAIVVCSNGGAQRGHTVELSDGRRHVFHHFGSGTLAGAETYLPKQFIMNPLIFVKEFDDLQKTFDISPICTAHPECLVSTPFDMILNQIVEENRGNNKHGSCGVGIWETIVRNGARFDELCNMSNNDIVIYLRTVRDQFFNKRLNYYGIDFSSSVYTKWKDIIYDENLINNFIVDFRYMASNIKATSTESYLRSYNSIIFENGQGLLLDQKFGEHSTPSNTGLKNSMEIINDSGIKKADILLNVLYITRPYLTRHGADPNFKEDRDLSVRNLHEDKTNVHNVHQGNIKYGLLDKKSLQDRIHEDIKNFMHGFVLNGRYDLVVTHVDQAIDSFDPVKFLENGSLGKYRLGIQYLSYGPTREDVISYF